MSSKSKKGTGCSGTKPYPFTRQFQRTLEQFPDLADTSTGEAASIQAASAVSGVDLDGMSLSTSQTQMPGPTSSQVQVPFSSLSADGEPTGIGSTASSFATPDQQRTASRKSARSSRHSPASDRGVGLQADQTVNRTMIPQTELSSSSGEEDSNGSGGRRAATSRGQVDLTAAATSAAQAVAGPTSTAARDPQAYRFPPIDYRLQYEELKKLHSEEMQLALGDYAHVADLLALKESQVETWHSTLGAKDELIQKLRAENEEWRQNHQVRIPPDL